MTLVSFLLLFLKFEDGIKYFDSCKDFFWEFADFKLYLLLDFCSFVSLDVDFCWFTVLFSWGSFNVIDFRFDGYFV